MRDEQVAIVAALAFGVLIGIPILLAIGAAILRGACAMCGVPRPHFGRAMGVVLLEGVVNAVVGVGAGLLCFLALQGGGASRHETESLVNLARLGVLPLQVMVSAGVFATTLEGVSFGQGILIWLCRLLIAFGIAIVVVALLLVLGLTLAALHGK